MAEPLDLTAHNINAAVDAAATRGHTLVLGYVDGAGNPSLSFRGSTLVHGPQQLAVWARNPSGGLVAAIADHPQVSLLFYESGGPGPRYLSFSGRARVDPSANDAVYEGMVELERSQDPERGGVAVIIDVDAVNGFDSDGPFRMERDAA
jgi:hypothetical protein